MFLFNVLVVVRRRLVGPPKDFQGGPDACVHLTSKPVLSKCSNLRKRSANVTDATARYWGAILGASPHSRTFFPSGSE